MGQPTARDPGDFDGFHRLLEAARDIAPDEVPALLREVVDVVGAAAARLYVADYALRSLQQIDENGAVGSPQPIVGTSSGRAFMSGTTVITGAEPTVVAVPLITEGDRIGLLELDYPVWDGTVPGVLEPVVAAFVMTLIAKTPFSDQWPIARRTKRPSPAAEIQWALLPPLACSAGDVSIGGALEPAYDIGGDSFDYAINGRKLEFAIIDAIGHGISAVLISTVTINGLRNARRAGIDLVSTYQEADHLIESHFGDSIFVTGQIASLDLDAGILTWINAGHVLPMLVRNGSYVGPLNCAPSMPMGLGGKVVEVATEHLQRGDRLLFYTDGITESRAPDGTLFGEDRLADFLVRSTFEELSVAETARRLSEKIIDYTTTSLTDDATLLLIEYRGHDQQA